MSDPALGPEELARAHRLSMALIDMGQYIAQHDRRDLAAIVLTLSTIVAESARKDMAEASAADAKRLVNVARIITRQQMERHGLENPAILELWDEL